VELGVGYKFGKIKPSLRDHSIASDVFETVSGSNVVKPVVDRWWWCGVRVKFNRRFTFGRSFGLFGWLGWGLGLAFVSCFNHC
jgi:hypothetical protein